MPKQPSKIQSTQKISLSTILSNWMTTLFAYQPEVYSELDQYRRSMSSDFVGPDTLQTELLKRGLLNISTDENNPRKLFLRLDSDLFKKSKGLIWTVCVNPKGDELEFSCTEEDPYIQLQNSVEKLIH